MTSRSAFRSAPLSICLYYLYIYYTSVCFICQYSFNRHAPKKHGKPAGIDTAGFFFAVILAKSALIRVLTCRITKYTFRAPKARENAAIGNPWARLRPTTCTRSVWSAPCRARSPLSCRPGVRHATPGLVLVSCRYLWGDRSPHANSCR